KRREASILLFGVLADFLSPVCDFLPASASRSPVEISAIDTTDIPGADARNIRGRISRFGGGGILDQGFPAVWTRAVDSGNRVDVRDDEPAVPAWCSFLEPVPCVGCARAVRGCPRLPVLPVTQF